MRFSKRAVALALAVVTGGAVLVKWGLTDPEPAVPSAGSVLPSAPAKAGLGASAAVPAQTPAPGSPAPAKASASGSRATASRPETITMRAWERNPPDLGLTRVLTGEQEVLLGGKPHKVLGTKPSKSEEILGQPVLLVRDEKSGQIEYFQSGLQFRLAAGASYSAFLQEHPQMQVIFYNTDFAKVKVDAALIAESFRRLSADPRVTFVGFLLPQAVAKPK